MSLVAFPELSSAGWTKPSSGEVVNRIGQLVGAEGKADVSYVPEMNDFVNQSATGPTVTASSDSELAGAGWRAFQVFWKTQTAPAIVNAGWIGNVANSGWLRVTFDEAVVINKFVISAIVGGNFVRSPEDFTIRASNTAFAVDDVLLDTRTGQSWISGETKTYLFTNFTRYTSYEIRISNVQQDGLSPGIGLVELRNIFDNTSPVFSLTNPLAIGQPIDEVPLSERNDPGSSETYDYEFDGGGLITGRTLAQIIAAWVGASPDFLDQFIVHMNSDGNGSPRFDLNGGVLAGFGGVADLPAESDVRLNVDYDSGNLTGSAAIPGASDVRDGVAVDATTGTYEPADEADVLLDAQYGAGGDEFTGTLVQTFIGGIEIVETSTAIEVVEV